MSNEYIKCDKGWHTGECCCNCQNQLELFKHPWNKINKGRVTESTNMYACIVAHDIDNLHTGIIFEKLFTSFKVLSAISEAIIISLDFFLNADFLTASIP